MSEDLMKWTGRIFAAAIAATIFTIDCIADFDVSISVLYICTLVAVGVRGSDREVIHTGVMCSLLSCISWYVVHGNAPDYASSLRLGFALIAIGVTAALLVSRKHLAAARRELEESRGELLNFTDSVPQLLWRYSVDRVDFFNRRYTDLTGHDREEAIAKQNWIEWYHPEDRSGFAEKMQHSLASGEDLRATFRMLHVDGTYRWMSVVGRAVRSRDGEILRWYGGTSDVHDEVTAHQELQQLRAQLEESQAELINFMDSVPQILWRATPEAYVDRYNRRFEDLIGRDLEAAILAQDWLDDFHPDDRDWFMKRVRSKFAAGDELRATYRLRYADGVYRWVSLIGLPFKDQDGKVIRYYGGTSDIHDEVLAREELQKVRAQLEQSRAEVEHFANSVPYILWRSNGAGEVQYFNKRWTDITGMPREVALEDQRYLETVHPDDLPGLTIAIVHAIETNGVSDAEVRVRQADGTYRWMRFYDVPVGLTADGQVQRFGGATDIQQVVDIRRQLQELNETLEQRVEERTADLIKTETRYASLFEVSNMTFAEMDFKATEPLLDQLRENGVTDLTAYLGNHPDEFAHILSLIRTTRVNEALAHLMGYESVAELVANPPAQNADDGPAVLLRQLEMYYNDIDHIDGRTVLVGKGGIEIPVYFMVNRLAEGLHLSSHINLTEQERIAEMREAAQEELARANRIATVGAFSASIAHELNQPIASMVMDAQTGLRYLQREVPDLQAAERILQRLTRTVQRVANIVQNTRDAIQSGQRGTTQIDLREMIEETAELLERELRRSDASFQLKGSKSPPLVSGDPVQVQQVLVNLMTNAVEAMREVEGPRLITLTMATLEDQAEVTVADSGPGIPEENLKKLFQPFFTTKAGGVGMGLQICRTAIEGMGGQLNVRNLDKGGAAFTFTLPTVAPGEPP
ncbi:PAS domain-containing sensor histidine kinase [Sphingobium ummariense]